jgi:hypothetical protein
MAEQQSNAMNALIAGGQAIVRIENDGMQQLAIQKPRPPLKQIINACIQELQEAPEFAKAAFYKIPYKEKADQGEEGPIKYVEGLTIKAAKMLQRHMRNISSGAREIDETDERVFVQGAAVDMETNTRTSREKGISKFAVNGKTKARYPLRQERFELAVEAGKSKAERNALLALMPEPLKQQVFITAKEIAARNIGATPGKKALPLKDRITVAIQMCSKVGFTRELMIRYMERIKREAVPEKWTEEDLGELIGAYNALTEDMITLEELVPEAKEAQQPVGEAMLAGMVQKAAEQTTTAEVVKEEPKAEKAPAPIATQEELQAIALRQATHEQLEIFTADINKVVPGFADGSRQITDKERVFVKDVIKAAWPGHEDTASVFGGKLDQDTLVAGVQKVAMIVETIISRRKG